MPWFSLPAPLFNRSRVDETPRIRRGAKRSLELYRAELPQEADIVVADSDPYDSELWVAAKTGNTDWQ